MNILTLTLNPAFDVHCVCNEFLTEHETHAEIISRDAGGKGVNISRALLKNDVESSALVLLGNQNGEEFCSLLKKEGLSLEVLCAEGRIRENITIHPKNAKETRLSFEGFSVNSDILEDIDRCILKNLKSGDILTVTGSLAKGISADDIKPYILKYKSLGIKVIIDSRSFSLDDLIEIKPYLIKPNEEEIASYLKKEISDISELLENARALYEKGIENVMISLGGNGALLVCSEGAFLVCVPKIEVRSSVGAGDSMLAGFISAEKENKSKEEALKTAAAFGSAACLTEGTHPPKKEDIIKLYKETSVKKL